MSARAIRRHHRDRIWAKRKYYYGGATDTHCWKASDPRKRMVVSTPKLCDRPCCSKKKQRAWGDVPHRERLALFVAEQQLTEWKDDDVTVEERDPNVGLKIPGV